MLTDTEEINKGSRSTGIFDNLPNGFFKATLHVFDKTDDNIVKLSFTLESHYRVNVLKFTNI